MMNVRFEDRRTAVWHLRAARLSLTIGDAAGARTEMQRLLGTTARTGMHSSGALRLLIDALIDLRQFDEALCYVKVGQLAYPHATGFCVRGARLALLTGRLDDAIQLSTTIILRGSTPRRGVLAILAESYAKTGRPADALRIYRQLLQDVDYREISAELLIQHAETCLAANAPEEGLRLLGRIVQAPPLLTARLLAKAGRTRDALDAYDRLLVAFGLPGSFTTAGAVAIRMEAANGVEGLSEESLLAASLERVEILDRLGALSALRHLAAWEIDAPSDDARVRLALARALASAGQSDLAYQLIRAARNLAEHQDEYLTILLMIAEIEGRSGLADRIARRLSGTQRGRIAEAARGALRARILRGESLIQVSAGLNTDKGMAGTDQPIEVESPLLRLTRNACRALSASPETSATGAENRQAHLTHCRVVMHRCRQKAACGRD